MPAVFHEEPDGAGIGDRTGTVAEDEVLPSLRPRWCGTAGRWTALRLPRFWNEVA